MKPSHQTGFALVIALVLLTVLTLVAVLATRGAGLEVQMAANSVSRIEAFESSEVTRRGLGEIIDVHTFVRGWPRDIGGTVDDDDFSTPMPSGFVVCNDNSPPNACQTGGTPRNWHLGNTERDASGNELGFHPRDLHLDARWTLSVATQPVTALDADIRVFKLAVDLNPGAGTAMLAGYEGLGKAAAAGGGQVLFYASSTARRQLETAAESETAAVFRHIIRN